MVFSPDSFWSEAFLCLLSCARYGGGKPKANLSWAAKMRGWWKGEGNVLSNVYIKGREMLGSEEAIVVYTHLLRKLGRELGGMPLVESTGNVHH